MNIRIIDQNKTDYYPILLEADPDTHAIDRYLEDGRLYVLEDDGVVCAVAVVLSLNQQLCELKNIAVLPAHQGQGLGAILIHKVMEEEGRQFLKMIVGTTPPTAPFYLKQGFVFSHIVPDFFVDNYPEPIFENGVQCVDMYYYERYL